MENKLYFSLKKGHAVAFDFDGVIHKYSEGWKDGSIYDEINPEIVELMSMFMKMEIPVFILSSRDSDQIVMWMRKQNMPFSIGTIEKDCEFWKRLDMVGVTNVKLPAQLYIDDRGYNYHGQKPINIITDLIKGD